MGSQKNHLHESFLLSTYNKCKLDGLEKNPNFLLQNLTLKAPITTTADNKFWDIFPNYFKVKRMPADNSHEILCLICYFLKSGKI